VHVDLYRIDFEGIAGLGIEEYMDNNHIIMVEWADVSREFFKGKLLDVKIEYMAENKRKIIIQDRPG
jgi:tRNA A37 threonylcarbamoyladenosine biosynthesis protein TsaE